MLAIKNIVFQSEFHHDDRRWHFSCSERIPLAPASASTRVTVSVPAIETNYSADCYSGMVLNGIESYVEGNDRSWTLKCATVGQGVTIHVEECLAESMGTRVGVEDHVAQFHVREGRAITGLNSS